MAPKRRGGKVVSSVVKTKVVKETVQVATTTILPDSTESLTQPDDTQPEPEVVDEQRSTDVHVEVVTTPDAAAEPPTSAKKAKKGGGQDAASPKSPEPPVVVPVSVQSQETQELEDPFGYEDQPEKTAPGTGKQPPQEQKKTKPAPEAPETPRQKKPKAGGGKSAAVKKGGRGRRRSGGGGSRPEMGYKRFVYRVLTAEAGAPGPGRVREDHGDPGHDDGRHVRAPRRGGGAAGQARRQDHADRPRGAERGQAGAARGARGARHLRGHQGRHQLHFARLIDLRA